MATLVLGAIGSALGANAFIMQMLMLVGSIIDSRLMGTASTTIEGTRMDDVRITTSTEGAAIPTVYGTIRSSGNIIWGTDFVEHRHEDRQGGKGGGGGGGGQTVISYTYTISFAVAICKGPVSSLGRVWADGKEFNISGTSYTFYNGSEDQGPDPYMQSILGGTNVPAYRGLCYIVFRNLEVEDFGNRIPNFTFEITVPIVSLADIIKDISSLAGYNYQDIDVSDLTNVLIKGYCVSAQSTLRERIQTLQGVYVFDGMERNGILVFRRRTVANSIIIPYDYMGATEGNISKEENSLVTTRKYELELPRKLTVKFSNKEKDYQQGAQSSSRIITSSIGDQSIEADIVLSEAEAKTVAENLLYEAWVNRTEQSVTLSNRFAGLLPGDIVELQSKEGYRHTAIVSKTSYGVPGLIKVSAIDVSASTYTSVARTVDAPLPKPTKPEPFIPNVVYLDIPIVALENEASYPIIVASSNTVSP